MFFSKETIDRLIAVNCVAVGSFFATAYFLRKPKPDKSIQVHPSSNMVANRVDDPESLSVYLSPESHNTDDGFITVTRKKKRSFFTAKPDDSINHKSVDQKNNTGLTKSTMGKNTKNVRTSLADNRFLSPWHA